jgi:outer membrane lipoprotein SlyB
VVRGRTQRLDTTEIEATAADSHERDAAVIGGGAAAGAIVGAISGGGKGAKKGAIIGGVAGTGAVLATKGKEVELPAGSRWTVRVKDSVKF